MSTATWFCPSCWSEVEAGVATCPSCGTDLAAEDRRGYVQRLIAALAHPLADRRLIAARVLGDLHAVEAIDPLMRVARSVADPYVAAEAVTALSKIDDARAAACVRDAARSSSVIVRHAAVEALRYREGGID